MESYTGELMGIDGEDWDGLMKQVDGRGFDQELELEGAVIISSVKWKEQDGRTMLENDNCQSYQAIKNK